MTSEPVGDTPEVDDIPQYGSAEFDWSLTTVADPMAMVRAQLEFSWFELSDRLTRLTDEEYSWEPAPGTLSVRRRDEARTTRTVGVGDWVVEWPAGYDDPGPRSISWLIAHLTDTFFERWEWTFGTHSQRPLDIAHPGEKQAAVEDLTRWVTRWINSIAGADPAEVYVVGRSQATEIDQQAPFGHLVLHLNRELIHHGAEIFLLQDLFAARSR